MKTTYWFIENVKQLMTDLNISQTKLAEKPAYLREVSVTCF